MAQPPTINIPEGEVTQICSNIMNGIVRNLSIGLVFLWTYRPTGESAPTLEEMSREGCYMFAENRMFEEVSFGKGVDSYVFTSSKNGKLRLDISS